MTGMRVLTVNICGQPTTTAVFPPLPVRLAGLARHLELSDVDIVNVQEVWTRWHFTTLRHALPSYPYVARRPGAAGRPAGGLVTFSRRPFRRVRYRSYRGIVPGTGRPRFRLRQGINSLLQGVLVVELDGITVANTHLTANKDGDWSAGNRYHGFQRAQLNRLHAVLRRLPADRPVVLTGDFNVAADSPLYPVIVDSGQWHDPFVDSGRPTFHSAFLPPGATNHRIDFVLVRGPATVVDTEHHFAGPENEVYLTDHVGLSARLSL
jgi:endonuclease/exonuclease/phosphatase (EEP) superfamily protein YafD